jgi:hypothetical protein
MLEVLHCTLPLCEVCEEVCQVDARAEVVLVYLKALFVILQALLEVLNHLICLPEIEEGARLRALLRVLDLEQQGLFHGLGGFFAILLFDEHLAPEQQCVHVFWLKLESSIDHWEAGLDVLLLLKVYLCQFDLDIEVVC